jgi:hypothetical protein
VSRQIIVVTTDFWFAPFSTLVGKTRWSMHIEKYEKIDNKTSQRRN